MRAKSINENISDILKPKNKADVKDSMNERIRQLQDMDVDDMIEEFVNDFDKYGPLDEKEVMRDFIQNIEVEDRKKIIELMYMHYAQYLAEYL